VSHQPSPPGQNGPTGLSENAGKDQKAQSNQTKSAWSDEEIDELTALHPTHSANAIAEQLGRSFNAIRSKIQGRGLKRDGPPTVASKPPKPAPKPRSLSAAVTADSTPVPGRNGTAGPEFSTVSLLDHHPGQCRWIVCDVWPIMYCGAPVAKSSSWCVEHSSSFNAQPRVRDFQEIPVKASPDGERQRRERGSQKSPRA
jgi:hypothetical protein